MICSKCGKNNAEFYYKQTINGKTQEYALCSSCAEELKKTGELNIKLPFLFDDYGVGFNNSALYGINDILGFPFSAKKKQLAEKKKCTLCASTFDDLVKSGKVGCAKCYEVFSDELQKCIENIHGKSKYMGKRTRKQSLNVDTPKDEVSALEKELKLAIESQEFEKAAVLRDKIREIKDKNKEEM